MKKNIKQTHIDDFQYEMVLSRDWLVTSSRDLISMEECPACSEFYTSDWYKTTVPTTVLAALVANGVYKEPYFGLNLQKIPGAPFKDPWWYRTEFTLDDDQLLKNIILAFAGINYKANIWLNRQQIAFDREVAGPFRRFSFDITTQVKSGKNILAVEVFPPAPGQFSIGFVDWNPAPPDQNMGIFRPVTLHFNDGVSINNPFVQSRVDLKTLEQAALTITAEVKNHTGNPVSGTLTGKIESITFSQTVSLAPGEQKLVSFDPDRYEQLNFDHPRLWWPNNLGLPNLYQLHLDFSLNNKISDKKTISFGIRDIQDYLNDQGHRGFKVNGQNVLIKGGGWTDDLFLQDTNENLEAQIKYVKHMNLNAIRLEGFWGKDQTLYDLCDRYGILVMVGWSCHWEHEQYLGKVCDEKYGGVLTPKEMNLISRSFQDQVTWLRHHPCIFAWTVGSDKLPKPGLERKYRDILDQYDKTRPYLASTGGVGSETGVIVNALLKSKVSGATGVKMLGPYDYTPPVYWHTDKKLGGAYGFNTETGPGAQVPPLASIKKMLPSDHLWPIDDYWTFHCARNVFNTLDRYVKALTMRYGQTNSVEEFAKKSQVLNYELMRPMFEAFQANKFLATGIIHWMLNSAWPKMYWQLYDCYLLPNAAFYGAKKACAPLHILYRYGFNDIYLVNDHLYPIKNLTAQIRIFDIHSKELFQQKLNINIAENTSRPILQLPEIINLTTTYFLDLRLYQDNETEIDNNFYWLSTKPDVLDYQAKVGDWNFYTPSKEYADLTLLNDLPKIKINSNHSFEKDHNNHKVIVTLENPTTTIAFFLDLKVLAGPAQEMILPIFWQDNYTSLLPGETRTIKATFWQDSATTEPNLHLGGWNLKDDK